MTMPYMLMYPTNTADLDVEYSCENCPDIKWHSTQEKADPCFVCGEPGTPKEYAKDYWYE